MTEAVPSDRTRTPFLTAQWRHLALLNYEVDPAALRALVPSGTELDSWHGRTFASVVGFLFLDTRILGVRVPFHREFEEVNLRFYVRRRTGEGWRRGVVFVKEIVPRRAVALVARVLYGESYVALPMSHRIDDGVSYSWRSRGRENRLELTADGPAIDPEPGSAEEFLSDHHWGYTRRGARTDEYRVEHPRWPLRRATSARLDRDAAALYGPAFAEPLGAPPASAFLADGSAVAVFPGRALARAETP